MYRIRFKTREYLLIGGKYEGAICTDEQYANFEPSFAHLFEDGTIRQLGQIIGTKKDIEWVKEVD